MSSSHRPSRAVIRGLSPEGGDGLSGASTPERHDSPGDRQRTASAHDRQAAPPSEGADRIVTVVPVLGMTCRTCELRIARYVGRIASVERVAASASRGRVVIESRRTLPDRAIVNAIRQAGYEVGETPWLSRDRGVWLTAIAAMAVVGGLAIAAEFVGVSRLTAAAGELSSGGVAVALLLGLAAGVSTCMALVGGLVLALSASYEKTRLRVSGAVHERDIRVLRPAIVFLTGRVVGYAVLGAALGAIGASVTMPPLVTAGLMIGVAIVMTILGARLTEVSPRIAGWSPTLPLGFARVMGAGADDGPDGVSTRDAAYSDRRAAMLGAASFFLPCGFTQAVQIFALSTGSPLFGAALLGAFALGTVPGLLALAGLPFVVPATIRPPLLRFVGVVVVGFGLLNASAGFQLAGLDLPAFGAGADGALTSTIAADGAAQTLVTHQDADGYSPGNVRIAAGIPTTWTIESSTTSSCAATLVIPAWNTGAQLKLGANTLSLPPLQPGQIRYSCAMGMYTGTITVVNPPARTTGAAGSGG